MTMSFAEVKLMTVVKEHRDGPPYFDVLQREAGLTDDEMKEATRSLLEDGLVVRRSAPYGELLYPTFRAIGKP